jgi:hypothetical protein
MINPLDASGSTVGITDPCYLIHCVHHIPLITGDSGCPPVYTGDLCWPGHKTRQQKQRGFDQALTRIASTLQSLELAQNSPH